jgi:transcriptional regulator with XRE-family HTH domain
MIKNDHQLKVAETKAQRLTDARDATTGSDSLTYASLLDEITAEIHEYLDVRAGTIATFEVSSLDDLADALVKARISAHLTQHEVAERLEIKEQMIQRYEAGGYENASLARIADVVDALGFSFHGWLGKSLVSPGTVITGASVPAQASLSGNLIAHRIQMQSPEFITSKGVLNAA